MSAQEEVSKTTNDLPDSKQGEQEEKKVEETKETQNSVNVSANNSTATSTTTTGEEVNKQDDENVYNPEEEVTEGAWNTPKVELNRIQVVTGEEEEETIWKSRAKLYRWSSNKETKGGGEWKERGVGDAKLLRHNKTQKIRFLLRQEKTHKIVANHYIIQRDMYCKLTPNVSSEKIWVWTVKDYADDPPKEEQFALKFAQIEQATEFKNKFDDAAKQNEALGLGKKKLQNAEKNIKEKEQKTN